MTKKKIDWDKELKPKPFRSNSFTPQMKRRVEQKAKAVLGPAAVLRRRAGMLGLAVLLLGGIFIFQHSGMLSLLRQKPVESTTTEFSTAIPQLRFPLKAGGQGATIALPLSRIRAELAIGEAQSDSMPDLPPMTFALTAEEAESLQAVLVHRPDNGSGYVLLAPRSWTPGKAVIGANGSWAVDFVNPADSGNPERTDPGDPGERLEYEETFSGSMASDIGTYFPSRKQWAGQQGFPARTFEGISLRSLYVTEGTETGFARYDWTRQGGGIAASGAAYYSLNPKEQTLRKLEMSLEGAAYSGAADTILRFFKANEGAQRIESAQLQEDMPEERKEPENLQTAEAVAEKLSEAGLTLTGLRDADLPIYAENVNGVQPEERFIDRDPADAARSERLSIFLFDKAEDVQAGAESFAAQLQAGGEAAAPDIYPHVFVGGRAMVVYWTSGSLDRPFAYDAAINGVLRALDRGNTYE